MNQSEYQQLARSLADIGRDEGLRARFLELLREVENTLARLDFAVRDEITGPIIDALHAEAGILSKSLSSGLSFDFHYRSKIARDFVMSPEERPDHVWEPQTTKLLVHLCPDAEHVIIGGAYSGDQAILVADRLRHSGGICHAFEPNRDQLAMLRRNAEVNGLDNIVFNDAGLWEDGETMLRLVGDDSFAHPEVAGDGTPPDGCFPTTSIDAYGAARGIERIGLIMLDIEGAELAALRGAEGYLSRPGNQAPAVVFEVHRHYVDWSKGLENTDIVRLMTDLGYVVFAVRDFNSNVPMGSAPVELVPTARTYLEGPPHGFNMLAVKDREIVNDDFFRIHADVSPKLLWHKDPKLHHPIEVRRRA